MAVADDIASAPVALASVTSASWSHTSSGSNRLGVVGIGATSLSGEPTVTTADWNATAMSANGSVWDAGLQQAVFLYRMTAPDTSSATIDLAFDLTVSGACGSVSLTGVDQATPMDTAVSATGTAPTGTSVVASSASGDMVIDTVKVLDTFGALTAGAGQTQQWNGGDGGDEYAASSTEAGAASVTMSWTVAAGSAATILAANVNATTGAAAADLVGSPSRMFHPGRGVWNVARFHHSPRSTDIPNGITVTPVTGQTDVGLSSQALVVKVARANPVATLGATATDTARKSAPVLPRSPIGLSATPVTRKSAPWQARSALGLVATPVTRKGGPASVLAALGLSATVSRVPTAAVVARAVVGLVSTALARKSAPAVSSSPVGLSSTDTVRKSAPVTPRSVAGLSARGLVTKVARATSSAALGLSSLVARTPSAAVVARAALGLVSRAVVTKKVSTASTSAVGASSSVTARRVARPTALASAGLSAVGTARKRVAALLRSVLGLTADVTTSPSTTPGQMYPREGTSATLRPVTLPAPTMARRDGSGPQMTRRELAGSTMTKGG